MIPSSASTFATAPSRESVLRVPSESSNFASRQSGLIAEKICLCLTCPAMTARVHAFGLESVDEFGQFPQREPVNRSRAPGFDLGESLFLDCGDYNFEPLSPCGIQNKEGKLSVAGDESELLAQRPLLDHPALRGLDELYNSI